MGKIVAIAVGAITFFVVFATGNTGGAIIFGLAMFGMSYGAFAWRPGEQAKSPVKETSSAVSPGFTATSVHC